MPARPRELATDAGMKPAAAASATVRASTTTTTNSAAASRPKHAMKTPPRPGTSASPGFAGKGSTRSLHTVFSEPPKLPSKIASAQRSGDNLLHAAKSASALGEAASRVNLPPAFVGQPTSLQQALYNSKLVHESVRILDAALARDKTSSDVSISRREALVCHRALSALLDPKVDNVKRRVDALADDVKQYLLHEFADSPVVKRLESARSLRSVGSGRFSLVSAHSVPVSRGESLNARGSPSTSDFYSRKGSFPVTPLRGGIQGTLDLQSGKLETDRPRAFSSNDMDFVSAGIAADVYISDEDAFSDDDEDVEEFMQGNEEWASASFEHAPRAINGQVRRSPHFAGGSPGSNQETDADTPASGQKGVGADAAHILPHEIALPEKDPVADADAAPGTDIYAERNEVDTATATATSATAPVVVTAAVAAATRTGHSNGKTAGPGLASPGNEANNPSAAAQSPPRRCRCQRQIPNRKPHRHGYRRHRSESSQSANSAVSTCSKCDAALDNSSTVGRLLHNRSGSLTPFEYFDLDKTIHVATAAAASHENERGADEESLRGGALSPSHVQEADVSQLVAMLHKIDLWEDFNIFVVSQLAPCGPLVAVGFAIFERHGFFKGLRIPEREALRYLSLLQSRYLSNPYHNAIHGADVAQTMNHFFVSCGLAKYASDEIRFASIFAALGHDVAHPGVTNSYLVQTWHPLAIRYNDRSPLEMMHASVMFELLQAPGANLLCAFTQEDLVSLRKTVVSMVLATENAEHDACIARLTKVSQTLQNSQLEQGMMVSDLEQIHILEASLHAADISASGKAWTTYQQWTDRLCVEFRNQGDLEKERGLPVLPFMDRAIKLPLARFQSGFIEAIVLPLYEALNQVPDIRLDHAVENIKGNLARWHESALEDDTVDAAPSTQQRGVARAARTFLLTRSRSHGSCGAWTSGGSLARDESNADDARFKADDASSAAGILERRPMLRGISMSSIDSRRSFSGLTAGPEPHGFGHAGDTAMLASSGIPRYFHRFMEIDRRPQQVDCEAAFPFPSGKADADRLPGDT